MYITISIIHYKPQNNTFSPQNTTILTQNTTKKNKAGNTCRPKKF